MLHLIWNDFIFIIIFWFLKLSGIKSIGIIPGNHFSLCWFRSLISLLFFQYYFVLVILSLWSWFSYWNCISLRIDTFICCDYLFYASVAYYFILVYYLLLCSWLDTSWLRSKSCYCSKCWYMFLAIMRYSTEFTFFEICFSYYKV